MVLSEDECILNGWNTHFQRLSTPDPGIENTEDPSAMECTLIDEILKDPKNRKEIPDITTTTTEQAIQKLKVKAPDHMGLTAEHFKKGGKTIANYTAALLNAAKKNYNIPEVLKTGLLTPVLKKEKDPKIPGNYRGIAVTPVLGKILESIIKDHIEPTLTKVQNPMQRGFTAKTSPINAAVVTTEGINEAKDNGKTVSITTLDAEKASDKLVHNILFRKLPLQYR
jgi:hypothetical protein